MNWLTWKQHRKQFLALFVGIVLYAALVIPTGLHFWHSYQHGLATCNETATCERLSDTLLKSNLDSNLNPSLPSGGFNLMILLILALPFLLGMFVGVPLIAREYIAGTNLLIWTRSISRRKWLTAKLAWTLVSIALFAGAFTALTTWWSQTGNILYLNRFDPLKFGMQGIAPIGYAVFAVSLGIALGTWLKRIMMAIGLTLVLVLVTQIMVASLVRPHYMAPRTKTVWTERLIPSFDSEQASKGALVTNYTIVNKLGQTLDWVNPPKQCVVPQDELAQPSSNDSHHRSVVTAGEDLTIVSANGGPAVKGSCLKTAGYHYEVKYQPADRYWKFQIIEMGLYLALSLIPLGITYRLVLKRDA